MLLDFAFSNFRSFKKASKLDLTPSSVRELSYSVLKERLNKQYKALSASVIYGANANGKSNVLLALEFLQELILGGNLDNKRGMPLFLAPNFHAPASTPIEFKIRFIHRGYLIDYAVAIEGAEFLENCKNSRIVSESLSVNGKMEFLREKNSIVLFGKNDKFNDNISFLDSQANSSLLEDELFLTNGYKTLISTLIYSVILDWFQNQLIIIRNVSFVSSAPKYDYEVIGEKNKGDEGFLLSNKIINKIARAAGIDSSEIQYEKSDSEGKMQAYSYIDSKGYASRYIESAGTMKIINFIPLVISVMVSGGTLLVDELDSSLHPSAVFSIVNAFHNDELNIRNAQLIFTTHNPIYQKAKIFRRDEIKFIEREDGASKIYNLSDFGTSGENGVKNSTDVMKNYLCGSYGAIKFVDFSDIIREGIELNLKRGG